MPLPYWPHPSHNLSDDDERSPLRWNIMVIHHIMEVLQYDDYDKCSLGFQEVKGYDSTAIHLDHMLSLFPKSVLHLIMIPPSSSLASRGSKLYIASAVCVLWDQLICLCWRMTVWKRFARSFLSIVCILLAWPFTILQNDNITISWDFLRLTAPAALPRHLGAVSLKKNLMILWYYHFVI